VIPVAGYMKF